MVNLLNVLDRISIEVIGVVRPIDGQFILDVSLLDGEDVLVDVASSVSVRPEDSWMVTRIEKNLNDFTMTITAERILV